MGNKLTCCNAKRYGNVPKPFMVQNTRSIGKSKSPSPRSSSGQQRKKKKRKKKKKKKAATKNRSVSDPIRQRLSASVSLEAAYADSAPVSPNRDGPGFRDFSSFSAENPLMGRPNRANSNETDLDSTRLTMYNNEHGASLHSIHEMEATNNANVTTHESESALTVQSALHFDYDIDDVVRVKFPRGVLGIAYSTDFIIEGIQRGGPGDRNKIQIGYKIDTLNGNRYEYNRFQRKLRELGAAGKDAVITFDTVGFKRALALDLLKQGEVVPEALRSYLRKGKNKRMMYSPNKFKRIMSIESINSSLSTPRESPKRNGPKKFLFNIPQSPKSSEEGKGR